MDGYCSSDSLTFELEEVGNSPDTHLTVPSPTGDGKPAHDLPSPSSPPAKRSRRSVQKRVVTVPIADSDGARPKGAGEAAAPPDSWAWRKYGQKPIKGSPYPRGYYRCSSSKGCPARKQVERSRADPTMLVITYSFDHNHPWPLPKAHHHHHPATKAAAAAAPTARPIADPPAPSPPPLPPRSSPPPEPVAPERERFPDLIAGETALHIPQELQYWLCDVGSPAASTSPGDADPFLYGPIWGVIDAGMALPEDYADSGLGGGANGGCGEEDALFAGLGELPECFGIAPARWCGATTR